MNLNAKLLALDKMYKIYNDFTESINAVCKKYCSLCCTRDVIMTSAEGYKIIQYIISEDKTYLFEKIKSIYSHSKISPLNNHQYYGRALQRGR